MIEIFMLFNSPENMVFTVMYLFCLGIIVLEAFLLVTMGLSINIGDFDSDFNIKHPVLGSWLGFGKIPFIVWLVIFFGGWASLGTSLNITASYISGGYLPWVLSVPLALVPNIILMRFTTQFINKYIPLDVKDSFHLDDAVGITASVVTGVARRDLPAEAKFKDSFGRNHYVMVVPKDDVEIHAGEQVVIWERVDSGLFLVVKKDSV